MIIEISDASKDIIDKTRKLKYFRHFTEKQIVEFAIDSYYGRKADDEAYEKYRRLQISRRLSFQGHACFYCKKAITRKECTLDHLIPKRRGGKSESENLVVACFECNHEKGDMTMEEYFLYRETHKNETKD